MRRYPALAWLLVFVGSIFVINGGQSAEGADIAGGQLSAGAAMLAVALGLATWWAFAPWPGHPRPRGVTWMYPSVVGFYVVCAVVALLATDAAVAAATLLAGAVPLTAVGLWIAHIRQKTRPSAGGDHDAAQADHTDEVPGFGIDTVRPLGDTPDAHDEVSPHDVPKGHPGRPATEREAAERPDATTPGHREGGAADVSEAAADRDDRVVSEQERREGARIRR